MPPSGNITVVIGGLGAYNMKKRVIAACVLLPLLLVVVLVLPKIFTAILFGLLAAIGAYELLSGTGLVKSPVLIAQACAGAVCVALWSYFGGYVWALLVILVYTALLYGQMLYTSGKLPYEKITVCLAAGLLVPFLLTALVRLHGHQYGRFYILIPFVLAFLSDTGAYFAGLKFGKHKLAPVISPKKTVEGVVGGVVGAVVGMMLFCLVLQLFFDFKVNYFYALIYGILGSLGAVFGDLSFSVVKRQTGIKDYGNLIPGHGGVLDRFDSMTVVAPLVEVLCILIPVVVK